MILFFTYFILFLLIIYKYNCFGITKDTVLKPIFFVIAFCIKLTGLLVFSWVYKTLYGTVQYSDTSHYFHDSQLIHSIAYWDISEFVKLMIGIQDESEGTELFQKFIQHTTVWDTNQDEFLYNDNRLMIRFHALIHFISAHNYYVHALFSCFVGFIGIALIYKTFKFLYVQKEILFFCSWLLFPGLWFWSASLLKEGPALFYMGCLLWCLKNAFSLTDFSIKKMLMLLLPFLLALTFKQHILLPLLFLSITFYWLYFKSVIKKYQATIYLILVVCFFFLGNSVLQQITNKSVIKHFAERQKTFIDLSNGGIFLLDSTRFIRLPYDTNSIHTIGVSEDGKRVVRIKAGVSYSYCELWHQKDTLYEASNVDTTSAFLVHYVVDKADTPIPIRPMDGSVLSFIKEAPYALWITVSKPFFLDARNWLDIIASLENGIILCLLVLSFYLILKHGMKNSWWAYFMSIVFVSLLIIGITSPNVGAIQRYRSLIIPFLLITPLLLCRSCDPIFLSKIFKFRSINRN